ncbi:peptidylprolyl isomerase [Vallitalea longa]|uniref:Peptidylprolyl isomerase n=1 Tax=Vallitalea longa TaxID=2936439 RepID=A0A9W6DEU2_9FIRM|nr:peptidylprolyl isomerase [Vallitalea longa]GKX30541.1 peptidylprolyl isomerase [Vallitalea longa]
MESTYGYISKFILLFMCIFLVGCSVNKSKGEQLDVNKDNETLITIDDIDIKTDEVMPYLLQVKMEFEELGGEDVWDHNDFSGGKKAEDVAKLGVLDNIIRTKILVEKANDMDIAITEDEKKEIESQALKYYNDLDEADIESYSLTKESILNSFIEYRIANKVTFEMTKDYIPKDEELENKLLENQEYVALRSSDLEELLINIRVRHILIKTHEKNDDDEYILISPDIEEKAEEQANEVYDKAVSGENYIKLVKQYSQDENSKEQDGEYILPLRLLDEKFHSLKDLEPGDISQIIQSDYGYHIFKILEKISPTKEEIEQFEIEFSNYENQLKERYKEQLKNDAFNKIYNEWENNVVVDLNEELWAKMDIFGNINENPIGDKKIE